MSEITKRKYWAWLDTETGEYRYIYRARFLVEMCSPDGFKSDEIKGKGRIVEVTVEEVK